MSRRHVPTLEENEAELAELQRQNELHYWAMQHHERHCAELLGPIKALTSVIKEQKAEELRRVRRLSGDPNAKVSD